MTRTFSPMRVGLMLLTLAALVWVLGVIVFTAVDLVLQVAEGHIRTAMYLRPDMFNFVDTGVNTDTPIISGRGGLGEVTVINLSDGAVVLHVIVGVLGILPQVTLGVVAILFLSRMLRDAPFAGPLAREASVASIAILAIAVAGALLAWLERSIIGNESGSYLFESVFTIDPLLVTAGLVLLLIASVFRSGERLQRETEGLV